jgi:CRISPR-associated protein Cas6
VSSTLLREEILTSRSSKRAEVGVPHIDLYFHVIAETVPLDHGFALYSALCAATSGGAESWLHTAEDVGLIPIRGLPASNHRLRLDREARFGLRLSAADVPHVLMLAGRRVRVEETVIRIGTPTAFPLRPAASLYSRIVTTRHGDDPARFDEEITRQLAALGIAARVERGDRRVIRIHGKKVIGHELRVSGLTPEASVLLQEKGLGGRRKMSAGVFVPARDGGAELRGIAQW